MAGRPKRRARQAQMERPSFMIDESGNFVGDGPPTVVEPAPAAPEMPAPPKKSDREVLDEWWRDQMGAILESIETRRAVLSEAEEHPSEIFARQALAFGAMGIPRDVVAGLLEISEADLVRYYGSSYEAGRAHVVASVAQNMLRMAMSGNDRVAVKAATEVLNRLGGEEWRPPAQKLEIDDSRKSSKNVIDSRQLSYEDRQALRAIIERSVGTRVEAAVEEQRLIEGTPDEG